MRALLLLLTMLSAAHATLYMVMEYGTDGTVILNRANITLHTLSINVTLLGCDFGYYDHYLLFPPTPSAKTRITPFDCRACTCTNFSSERAEDFIVAGTV
jgi:hypothetical protein